MVLINLMSLLLFFLNSSSMQWQSSFMPAASVLLNFYFQKMKMNQNQTLFESLLWKGCPPIGPLLRGLLYISTPFWRESAHSDKQLISKNVGLIKSRIFLFLGVGERSRVQWLTMMAWLPTSKLIFLNYNINVQECFTVSLNTFSRPDFQ